MCLKILTLIFIIITIVLSSLIVIQKIYMEKLKTRGTVAVISFLMLLYALCSIISIFLLKQGEAKIIMLLFGISPYIIGYFVTYKTEKYFTPVQIFLVILSAFYLFNMSGIKL